MAHDHQIQTFRSYAALLSFACTGLNKTNTPPNRHELLTKTLGASGGVPLLVIMDTKLGTGAKFTGSRRWELEVRPFSSSSSRPVAVSRRYSLKDEVSIHPDIS